MDILNIRVNLPLEGDGKIGKTGLKTWVHAGHKLEFVVSTVPGQQVYCLHYAPICCKSVSVTYSKYQTDHKQGVCYTNAKHTHFHFISHTISEYIPVTCFLNFSTRLKEHYCKRHTFNLKSRESPNITCEMLITT